MNLKKIYRDLGFSIRKVNEDEIEIKNSTLMAIYVVFLELLLLAFFL